MLLPEVLNNQVADKYQVVMPSVGFAALASAVELDTTLLDAFTVTILDCENGIRGGHAGKCTVTKKLYDDNSVTREANIEIYVGQFFGYGEHGLSIELGRVQDVSPEQIEDMNLSGVVLHELLHLSRVEKKERGELIPFLPNYSRLRGLSERYPVVDEDERYVRFRTYELFKDNPVLWSAVNICQI